MTWLRNSLVVSGKYQCQEQMGNKQEEQTNSLRNKDSVFMQILFNKKSWDLNRKQCLWRAAQNIIASKHNTFQSFPATINISLNILSPSLLQYFPLTIKVLRNHLSFGSIWTTNRSYWEKKKVFHCWQVFLRAFTKIYLVVFQADSHSYIIQISLMLFLVVLYLWMCTCKGDCILLLR